jgi:hypothetical protein
MSMSCTTALALAAILGLAQATAAQPAPGAAARSLVRAGASLGANVSPDTNAPADSGTYAPSQLALIENRARTLGNQLSASRTRYFAVTDADLRGLSPEAALARLAPPPVTAADGVRNLNIVINLTHPITLASPPTQPVTIGTAIIDGAGIRNIHVQTYIFAPGLTVLDK